MHKTVHITDDNFEEEVLKSELPVLVDFWAVWCGPCKMQDPIVEEVAKAVSGKAKVGKLNVDENPSTAQKFGMMSIPTILIFDKGVRRVSPKRLKSSLGGAGKFLDVYSESLFVGNVIKIR